MSDQSFNDFANNIVNVGNPEVDPNLPRSGGNGQGPMITDLQRLFLQSNGVEDTSKYSYNEADVTNKYAKTYKGINNEELYAQGQGWANKMVNGVGKGLLLTGTTFLQGTVGMVNGVAQAIGDGRAASFYDNDMNRWIDGINKEAENNWMPNYYTQAERDANWYSPSKLFSANFLWDGIIKNLGFAAGAYYSGAVYASALKALPLTSRLFSSAKAAETLAATEEGLLTANKASGTFGKVKGLSDKFLTTYGSMTTGGRALVAGLSTTGEASFEAYQNLNQFRDKLIEDYKKNHFGMAPTGADLAAINQNADAVGNSSFLLNTALLTATNYIQFPKILGSAAKVEKGMLNGLTKEINAVTKDAAGNLIAAPSRYGKLLTTLNKIRPYTFSATEAFEEGAQYAIQVGTQDYYNKKYKGDAASFLDSATEGVSKTLTTNEGMENVLIGGLSGSIMLGRGRYRENVEKEKNTADFIKQANAWKVSDFTRDTIDSINRGTAIQEEREGHLRQGDILESKDSEADYIINYLTPRIKYGRFDMVQADVNDLKMAASTEEGFAELQSEGKALPGDTREAYLQRLANLEATGRDMHSLYQSLIVRYGNLVTKEGKPVYNQEVMDKMLYAATKVADYDTRMPQLSQDLSMAGIDVPTVIDDIISGESDSFNETMAKIDALDILGEEKVTLKQNLDDISELALRRQQFLKEYTDIKNNPEAYTTPSEKISEEGATKETVKVKTKDGEEDIEIGTEYYLGRTVKKDKNGKDVYGFPKLTILGKNEDGTIKIKGSDGIVRDISAAELAGYKLGKVSDTLNNKKANFFMENSNTVFQFNFGKGNKVNGRLQFSPKEGILEFVYKDKKGKTKTIEVTGDQFVAKEGFANPMISAVGKLTAAQESALSEFTNENDARMSAKRESRLKILNDLFDEVSDKITKTKTLLEQKKSQFEKIVADLTKLQEDINNAEFTKTNVFKRTAAKSIAAAVKLSRTQEQLKLEIEELEAQQEQLEINREYIADTASNIDTLPTDSKEFLEELKEQKNAVEDLIIETGKSINAISKLIDSVGKALNDAVEFALDLIRKFEAKYPNLPYTPLGLRQFLNKDLEFKGAYPEYTSYLQANPTLIPDLIEFENDLANIDELDVTPNERTIEELKAEMNSLQEQLEDASKQLEARELVLNRFQDVADAYKRQQEEERAITRNRELMQQFLGINSNDTQTVIEDGKYQQEAKKNDLAVVGGTIPINTGKAHQIRANNFGFRFPSLPNRDSIKGLIVTSKTEEEAGLPGLMAHLYEKNPETVIALVMVQENEDGTFTLVDEFGVPLPQGADTVNSAIYQVFPESKLTATYNGEVQSMFRNSTPENVKEALTKQYAAWREQHLTSTTLGKPQGVNASFGFPEYVTYKDDNGNDVRDDDARVGVTESGAVSESDLQEDQVLIFATTNEAVSNGSVTFNTPLGRVFLKVPGGLIKLFNRKFNNTEANTLFDVIHQLSKNATEDKSIKTERSQLLLKWLKSVSYWGIAKDTQGNRKEAGYNNIWFEDVVEDGKTFTKLFISGKGEGFALTPQSLENNKADIITLLSELHFNADAYLSGKEAYNKPYFEITSIDKEGKPVFKRWENYQTFLLSSEGRTADQIPFTSKLRAKVDENDVNRKDIYFTLTNTADDYVLPTNQPVVASKPADQAPAPKPVAQQSAPAKASDPGVFVLDGQKENTIQLGNFGSTTFKLDGKKFNETNGDEGFTPTFDGALVKALMDAKGYDQEKAQAVIANSILAKVKDQLEALKIPVQAPLEELSQEDQDDWNNNPVNAPDDKAYRLEITKGIKKFEKENWIKLERWLKATFPNIPVYRVKNIIQATNGRQAWGMLHNAAIYVYENAEVGTAYHEVFEAVWKMFATPEERVGIIEEFKQRKGSYIDVFTGEKVEYATATDEQIKEKLAEDFREYVLTNRNVAVPKEGKTLLGRLFAHMVNAIRTFFTGDLAQVNTANLFAKIGNGYYAKYNPYESRLNLVGNSGIIDIKSAEGDETSEFRIANIPATQVHEIMQQMTYSTLAELSKTNKSLFTVPDLNKKDLYERLKSEVKSLVRWQGSLIEKDVADKKLTAEDAAQDLSNLKVLYSNIDAQWNALVKKHAEYLKTFSIEFDENDNAVINGEDKTGKGDWQDARKIDNFKKANSAIKLLVGTLPIMEVKADGPSIKRTSIGGALLMPSDKVFITLMNNLHTSVNIDDMLTRLRKLAIENPNYETLYKRITKRSAATPGIDFSQLQDDHDLQLITAFWRTFKKQSADVRIVFVLPSGEVVIGDSTLASAAKQARSEMTNDIISTIKAGSQYIKYNEKEKVYNSQAAVQNVKLNPTNLSGYTDFLKNLGIEFNPKQIAKMKDNQVNTFRTATEGILKSLSEASGIGTLNSKTLDIDGQLLKLGSIKAILDKPEFESTYFNLNGERTQTFMGTNVLSDMYDAISKVNKISELGGTQYKYLTSDPFSIGSNVIGRIFNLTTGNRKAGTEELLKTAYVDGTVNEDNGKKKESSKLSLKDRIVQEINLNLDGYYMNLVPGDASIEWMVKLGNAIDADTLAIGYDEVHRIFKEYFMAEVNLAKANRPIVQDSKKTRKSTDLRFFKSMLSKETHDAIVKELPNKTASQIYDTFESDIKKAVVSAIETEAKTSEATLKQYGVITANPEGIVAENLAFSNEDNITQEALDLNLKTLAVNYMIANIELHKLVYSDPYQYKDELKRIKNFNSPRNPLIGNSVAVNTALNKTYNKGFAKTDKIGYTDMLKDYFRSITISDVFGTSDLPDYGVFEETDGGGYITMKANRNFRIRAGKWNANEERQFRYDVAYEKNVKGIELSKEEKYLLNNVVELTKKKLLGIASAYTPIKPIVSGNKGNGRDYNDVVLDKFALVPMSFRILHQMNPESNAIKFYDKMQEENIDYAVYGTGRKVGAEKMFDLYVDGEFNSATPFETEAEINDINLPQGVINIPFTIMGEQSEVPSKEDALTTQGSQITKLATLDLMEAGVPIDFEPGGDINDRFAKWIGLSEDEKMKSEIYREVKKNQELLEAKIEEGYKTLLKKLGIKQTKEGFVLDDKTKMAETLKSEILKREVNENITEAFDGFEKGDVILEATPAYQQIRNILYSIADKNVVSPKISGGLKVQIPNTLLESKKIAVTEKGAYTSELLKFYEKDGERVCEIMVARWFKSSLSDKELLNYLNNTKEGKEILRGIAFRIPTQKQNSIDSFVIKQFLPKDFGDSVVIPSELVKKVGSDFDIDKLSVYLKNVYEEKGYPKLIPYFGMGEEAKVKVKEFFSKRDVETDPTIADDYDAFYKKSLENEYISSLQTLVSHPLNFDRLVTPNSADQLKEVAREINKALGRPEIDYSSTGNMLSRTFMTSLRQAFVSGKYAIGIAATAQTNHSVNQRAVIYVDNSRMKNLPEADKKWLGDGKIKFNASQYNSINVEGKGNVPTLSLIKNKAGDFISDIIGQFIDGYVDIAKGPWIMDMGATRNTAGTWLFLTKLGVPIKTVAYFMNQPIVRDYVSSIENAGYSYLFIDKFAQDAIEMYEPSEKIEVTEIPSQKQLKEMMGKKWSDMTPLEKAQQQFILQEFTKYAKMAEQLFYVQQGSNYDTAAINDPYLVFKKRVQLEKARNTIISSVDDVLNNSFVGFLQKTVDNIRNAFGDTVLMSDRQNVRKVMEEVLLPFVDMSDRDFVKISQKAVNDLFDWAVQTDRKINGSLQAILLGKDSAKSAAEQIMTLQKEVLADKEHPLYNNLIINSIRNKPGQRPGSPNNLYIAGKDNKVYDQNQIIYGFRELKKYLLDNNKNLYGKLVRLAVMQSGLNNSPIAFTSLLPYDDFKEVYNETLSKLENMPNLAQFAKLDVFQRNNWNNNDVVFASKATWRKSKKEKWLYNTNMMFIDKRLSNAKAAGKIPQLVTFSPFSAEARHDFVVYSWENGTYSKAQKAAMRKKGDYSYINKALFKKVYVDKDANIPMVQSTKDKVGNTYEAYVYKAINAWGDGIRANEFYDTITPSVLDNGFIKVEKKSETVTIPGTSSTYNVYSSDEVEDSEITSLIPETEKDIFAC